MFPKTEGEKNAKMPETFSHWYLLRTNSFVKHFFSFAYFTFCTLRMQTRIRKRQRKKERNVKDREKERKNEKKKEKYGGRGRERESERKKERG